MTERLRLYSASRNSAGWRVRIALALKGIAYDYISTRTLASGEYRRINPQGLMPALEIDGASCRVRLRGSQSWQPAKIGPGSTAFAGVAYLDICTGRGRLTWLLTRSAAPAASFRSLKARLRLSC